MQGWRDHVQPGPPSSIVALRTAIGWLLVASVLAMTLLNAGPLAVEVLASPSDEHRTGVFLVGLVVARVPLFFFGALQAVLVPDLAELAATNQRRLLKQRLD